MRFCDLFISYKIALKELKSTIPFTVLPLYRKIAIITMFSLTIILCIFFTLKSNIAVLITFFVIIILIAIFRFIDSRKENLEIMLQAHYLPYSQERMDMIIKILQQYQIDIHNASSINLLIEEAQTAQIQYDYFLPLRKPLKTLSAAIIPIVIYVANKIGDNASQNKMIQMSIVSIIIILLIFSLVFTLGSIAKDIFYQDYNKCDELIYDLRQVKLFYTKKS